MNDTPLILHTCDKYSQYWNYWWYFFTKHCSYKNIIFASEIQKPDFHEHVTCFLTGQGPWGERILKTLKSINNKYIYYMQEDFWPIENRQLDDSIIQFMDLENADCFRISPECSLYSIKNIYNNLYQYEQNSSYTLSHQFSVWNREFLIRNIFPHENPWQNEIDGSLRINNKPHKIFYSPINWYNEVVRKGNITTLGIEMLNKENIKHEFNKVGQ